MAVRRRSATAMAIAANPSFAILRVSARGLLGVEGAEPLVSLPRGPTKCGHGEYTDHLRPKPRQEIT